MPSKQPKQYTTCEYGHAGWPTDSGRRCGCKGNKRKTTYKPTRTALNTAKNCAKKEAKGKDIDAAELSMRARLSGGSGYVCGSCATHMARALVKTALEGPDAPANAADAEAPEAGETGGAAAGAAGGEPAAQRRLLDNIGGVFSGGAPALIQLEGPLGDWRLGVVQHLELKDIAALAASCRACAQSAWWEATLQTTEVQLRRSLEAVIAKREATRALLSYYKRKRKEDKEKLKSHDALGHGRRRKEQMRELERQVRAAAEKLAKAEKAGKRTCAELAELQQKLEKQVAVSADLRSQVELAKEEGYILEVDEYCSQYVQLSNAVRLTLHGTSPNKRPWIAEPYRMDLVRKFAFIGIAADKCLPDLIASISSTGVDMVEEFAETAGEAVTTTAVVESGEAFRLDQAYRAARAIRPSWRLPPQPPVRDDSFELLARPECGGADYTRPGATEASDDCYDPEFCSFVVARCMQWLGNGAPFGEMVHTGQRVTKCYESKLMEKSMTRRQHVRHAAKRGGVEEVMMPAAMASGETHNITLGMDATSNFNGRNGSAAYWGFHPFTKPGVLELLDAVEHMRDGGAKGDTQLGIDSVNDLRNRMLALDDIPEAFLLDAYDVMALQGDNCASMKGERNGCKALFQQVRYRCWILRRALTQRALRILRIAFFEWCEALPALGKGKESWVAKRRKLRQSQKAVVETERRMDGVAVRIVASAKPVRRRRKRFVAQRRPASRRLADVKAEAVEDQGKPMILDGCKVVSSTFFAAAFVPCEKHIENLKSREASCELRCDEKAKGNLEGKPIADRDARAKDQKASMVAEFAKQFNRQTLGNRRQDWQAYCRALGDVSCHDKAKLVRHASIEGEARYIYDRLDWLFAYMQKFAQSLRADKSQGNLLADVLSQVEAEEELFRSDTRLLAAFHHGYLNPAIRSCETTAKEHAAFMAKMYTKQAQFVADFEGGKHDAMVKDFMAIVRELDIKRAVFLHICEQQRKKMDEKGKEFSRAEMEAARAKAEEYVAANPPPAPAPLKRREIERLSICHKAYLEKGEKHMAPGTKEGERSEQATRSGAAAHNFDCEDFMCYLRRLLKDAGGKRMELVLYTVFVGLSRRYNERDHGDKRFASPWASGEFLDEEEGGSFDEDSDVSQHATLPAVFRQHKDGQRWLRKAILHRARNLQTRLWKTRVQKREETLLAKVHREAQLAAKMDAREAQKAAKLAANLALPGGYIGATEEERRQLEPLELLAFDMDAQMSARGNAWTGPRISNQMRLRIQHFHAEGGIPIALFRLYERYGVRTGLPAVPEAAAASQAQRVPANSLPLWLSNANGQGQEVPHDVQLNVPERIVRFEKVLRAEKEFGFPHKAKRKRQANVRLQPMQSAAAASAGGAAAAAAAESSSSEKRKAPAKRNPRAKKSAATPAEDGAAAAAPGGAAAGSSDCEMVLEVLGGSALAAPSASPSEKAGLKEGASAAEATIEE